MVKFIINGNKLKILFFYFKYIFLYLKYYVLLLLNILYIQHLDNLEVTILN